MWTQSCLIMTFLVSSAPAVDLTLSFASNVRLHATGSDFFSMPPQISKSPHTPSPSVAITIQYSPCPITRHWSRQSDEISQRERCETSLCMHPIRTARCSSRAATRTMSGNNSSATRFPIACLPPSSPRADSTQDTLPPPRLFLLRGTRGSITLHRAYSGAKADSAPNCDHPPRRAAAAAASGNHHPQQQSPVRGRR